jgi:hypothetical protein
MLEVSKVEHCTICNDVYTSIHVEVMPGFTIYVCDSCIEAAKFNFIWICMSCGKVYMRPKKLVIQKTRDFELKKAYLLCEDMQIIQGVDMCIECDPDGIMKFMSDQKIQAEC